MDLKKIELKYLFRFLITIFILFFVFELNYYRHWTSIQDQDLTLIHNSLLLNSGFKAEYHDHPGHTKILFLSLWLNLLEIIKVINISSYNDLKISENIRDDFIKLVTYSRFINFIIGIIFAYVFYSINKVLTNKRNRSYLLTILFVTSFPFINSISHIRTELVSSTFIFFSLLYLLKIVKKSIFKRKYIFYFGFFFILSIFSKFQSIFIFIFFPLFLSFLEKKKIEISKLYIEKKNLHLYLSLIIFTGIFLIWFKYAKGINLIFFPIFTLYLYIFLKYIDKKFFGYKKNFFIFLFYFLLGICFSFVLLYILKPFHTNNISMIANFFGASSMFVQGTSPYELNLIEAFKLINKAIFSYFYYLKLIFLTNSYTEIIFLLLCFITFGYNYKKKNRYLKDLLLFYFFLIAIIFLFSVRPSKNYLIYFVPFIYFFFNYSFNSVNQRFFFSFLVIILLFVNLMTGLKFISDQKFFSQVDLVCSKEFLNKKNFFYERMRLEILPLACKIN